MKILQYIQLNNQQKTDAISKIVGISKKLNVPVCGMSEESMIRQALQQDGVPDAEFIFDEINENQVDVIYRENI